VALLVLAAAALYYQFAHRKPAKSKAVMQGVAIGAKKVAVQAESHADTGDTSVHAAEPACAPEVSERGVSVTPSGAPGHV